MATSRVTDTTEGCHRPKSPPLGQAALRRSASNEHGTLAAPNLRIGPQAWVLRARTLGALGFGDIEKRSRLPFRRPWKTRRTGPRTRTHSCTYCSVAWRNIIMYFKGDSRKARKGGKPKIVHIEVDPDHPDQSRHLVPKGLDCSTGARENAHPYRNSQGRFGYVRASVEDCCA
jgi:hypothetical protein